MHGVRSGRRTAASSGLLGLHRLLRAASLGAVWLGAASCVNPRAEASVAQALNDAASEISGLKDDVAQLQTQLDSLHEIVAKQDTLIRRIAAVNNVPLEP